MINTISKIISLLLMPTLLFCTTIFDPVSVLAQQKFESPALAAEAFVDAVATRNT